MCIKPFAKNQKELDALTLKSIKGAKFMAKIKTAAKVANSPETAIPFYIDTEHKYADTTGCFLHFGKIKPFKADAKEIAKTTGARGAMFITTNEKGTYIITLMIAQGKIKQENKLVKALRELASVNKATIVVGKDLDEKALDNLENTAEAAQEIADLPEDANDSVDATPTTETPTQTKAAPAQTKAVPQKNPMIDALVSTIGAIGAKIKGGDKTTTVIASLKENVEKYLKAIATVTPEEKAQYESETTKIQALQNQFSGNGSTKASTSKEEITKQNKTIQAEIAKLLKEIDLNALLKAS